LIFDGRGILYGTDVSGGTGTSPSGTVFRLTPPHTVGAAWTETLLHTFCDCNGDGIYPMAGLTFDSAGNLWGTDFGGAVYGGNLFRLTPPKKNRKAWSYTVRYNFKGPPDGYFPTAALIFDKTGNLYSTTQRGGSGQNCFLGRAGCGIVFQFKP
jgi:hypothetical protein